VGTAGRSLLYVQKVEFHVLGPIEVVTGGERLELGGPKQRTLLALLVANAGRPMSTDALIDGAYGDEAPDGARRSVQTYISNLRSLIGDTIRSVPSGYQFTPIDSWIDADQFVSQTESGRALMEEDPAKAGTELREALALWRGHPFSDVEARGHLDSEITRLNELRLVALETRIDADLAAGRDRELVGELEALTAEYPFRESFRSQHMLALYRSGRQADALRAYTRMREDLVEQLGVDPSPDLRLLEQRILDQDPTLTLSPQSAVRRRAVLVVDLADISTTGLAEPDERRRVLADIDRALETAIAGASGVFAAQQATATYSTFDDVQSAIRAVAAISRSVPGLDGHPLVRMAVDVGQVEEEPTGAIAGPAVIRAAGLVAMSHPGQVLLSSEAQTDIAADTDGGALVRSLGRHPIARLEQPETIHQLVIDGLASRFPALRTGAEPPGLPTTGVGVPGYELREEIGHGLFGTVYRGYQPSVGREVAIKVIKPNLANSPGFIRRFAVEARMISQIEHPNVVPLYDFWRGPDRALLVMRLMRGGNLTDWRESGEMTRDVALRLVDQVGGALATAHKLGIAHGDVQATNILLNDAGDFYLSDFGIAGEMPILGGEMAQQLDVAAFASMVAATMGPGLLGDAEAGVLEAGRRGDFTTAGQLLSAWRLAVGAAAESPTYTPSRNPYKGLVAFGELDKQDFHGRVAVTEDLLAAVAAKRLVAVVGPSGIGKSSVVRAGLLPELRSGGVPGSDRWLIADCIPGPHPFERLATSIMRVASTFPHDLEELLGESDRGLVKTVDRYLPPDSHLLLVIDQFEELFTLVRDEDTRDRFLRLLAASVTDEAASIRVLITARSDFLDRPLRHPAFGELIRRGTVLVSAPTDAELRLIIERPAARVGVDFEPGLVERITNEVHGEAGALPLLEFTLTELFEQRDSNLLTLDAYRSSGGVTAALGRRAEGVYSSFQPEDHDIVRQVFMRLVTPGADGRDTRRRVRVSELELLDLDAETLQLTLTAFGKHRLLTFDHDEITRGATVEVAHEALLHEWPRLANWIDEHREELLLRSRLAVAVADWESSDRSDSYLLSRGRLAQHETWTTGSGLTLSRGERELLESSRRAEDERALARRRLRRAIMSGLAIAAAVGVVLSAVAFNASRHAGESERVALSQAADAEAARVEAQQSATLAQARELILGAEKATAGDSELGIQLAIRAIERFEATGDVPGEAVTALRSAIAGNRVVARFPSSPFVAANPDGSSFAIASQDGGVSIIDAESFEPIDSLSIETGPAVYAWYSGDGAEMFIAGINPEGRAVIWAVDTKDGSRELLPGPAGGLDVTIDLNVDVSATGDVAERRDGVLTMWDRATGNSLFELPAAPFSGSDFARDGRLAYVALDSAGNPTLNVVDGTTGEQLDSIAISSFVPSYVTFSPDGRRVALSEDTGWVGVVDLDTKDQPWRPFQLNRANSPLWSPDGSNLLIGGERPLEVLEAATGLEVTELATGSGGSLAYAWVPGSDLVVMNTYEDDTLVLDLASTSPEALESIESPIGALGLRVTPDGERIVAREAASGFATVDLRSGDVVSGVERRDPTPVTLDIGMSILTADGQFASALDDDMRYKIWPTTGGEPIYTAESGWVIVGLNADASLAVLKKDQDPTARLVDTNTNRLVAELDVGPWLPFATFSPDGRYLIGSTDETPDLFRVFDTSDGSLVAQFGGETNEYGGLWVRFVPTGDTVVVTTPRGDVIIFDFLAILNGAATEDAITRIINAHDSFVFEPAISPDGTMLATNAQGEPARVWDISTGRLLDEVGTGGSKAVAFDPIKPWLYVAEGNTITAHTLDIDALVALGRSTLTRDLTAEECQQYLHGPCDA